MGAGQDFDEQVALGGVVDEIDLLHDAFGCRGDGRDLHASGIVEHLVGEFRDLARHGRREKNSVWRCFGSFETMRRIGTMKPRSSMWSASSSTTTSGRVEAQAARVHVIEQAAGRGDQHVEAARDLLDLRAIDTPPTMTATRNWAWRP